MDLEQVEIKYPSKNVESILLHAAVQVGQAINRTYALWRALILRER